MTIKNKSVQFDSYSKYGYQNHVLLSKQMWEAVLGNLLGVVALASQKFCSLMRFLVSQCMMTRCIKMSMICINFLILAKSFVVLNKL